MVNRTDYFILYFEIIILCLLNSYCHILVLPLKKSGLFQKEIQDMILTLVLRLKTILNHSLIAFSANLEGSVTEMKPAAPIPEDNTVRHKSLAS